MLYHLERALAIEAARTGEANGEATMVLEALPPETGSYAPRRLRRPRQHLLLLFLLLFVGAGAVGYVVATSGGGTAKKSSTAAPPPQPVAITLTSAKDYDPLGGDGEHPELVSQAIDGNQSTAWHTQTYAGGNLGKAGVGLYVAAASPVAARQLTVYSATPGWKAEIYGSDSAPADIGGWGQPLARGDVTGGTQAFQLDTAGRSFRNYLIWITSLPGAGQVSINEVKLRR
jgi:hypothetical protein